MERMNLFGNDKVSERKTPAYGIDLGTTNSAISVIKEGTFPEVIRLDGGAITLPSCVMWKGRDGEFIVGKEAYNNRYKESTIYSVKRLMGSGQNVTLKYGGKDLVMTPAQVSAEILKELVKQASVRYGEIKDVVITVPAYFDNKQIEDTLEAGKLAGLNVLGTLREPTSASLTYNQQKNVEDSLVLVYDLGGGTFDISLVRISKVNGDSDIDDIYNFEENTADTSMDTVLTVLKNEGDMKLGGDDIDLEMYKIFESKIAALGYDVNFIPRERREELILLMEKFKKEGVATYKCPINFKLNDVEGTKVDEAIMIEPADFEKAAYEIYKKTKVLTDLVLQDMDRSSIASIVLVGGSTKSEFIKSFLKRDFPGIVINDALNPDESVALGAGIQAKRMKYGSDNLQVFDIIPLSIGILADGYVNKVIMKNQSVPYTKTKVFTNTVDNQQEISIDVYQGNSPLKEECVYLGSLVVKNIPKGNAFEIPIPINLTVNANGVLECSTEFSGKKTSVQLVNLFGKETKSKELTAKERKAVRWTRFAETLEPQKRTALTTLIQSYVAGSTEESTILEFISNNRVVAEVVTRRIVDLGIDDMEA